MTHVLIAEDEQRIASFIEKGLSANGFAVTTVADGRSAYDYAATGDFDLMVLDIGLPELDGFEVLRRLRAEGHRIPVIVLTARSSVRDTVAGLEGGADDYMGKPFSLAELTARIRALMRRGKTVETRLKVGDLELDVIRRKVTRAGKPVELKPKEFALLEYLMRNSDRPVTKSLIIEHVWDIHFDSISNVVEVHINSLRNKIDRGADLALIRTVRGVGYMVTDQPA